MSYPTARPEHPNERIPKWSESSDVFERATDKMMRSKYWNWLTDAMGSGVFTMNIIRGNGDTTVTRTRPLRGREQTVLIDRLRELGFETDETMGTFHLFLLPDTPDTEYDRLCKLVGGLCEGSQQVVKRSENRFVDVSTDSKGGHEPEVPLSDAPSSKT